MPSVSRGSTRGRRRPLLAALLASISVNAALGIYALLVPHFGALQGRVLMTSFCVTGAGVLAFACLPAWEQRRLAFLPLTGIAASTLGFALVAAGIWTRTESESFSKSTWTVFVVVGVCVLASVLSLVRLASRYRRVFPIAVSLAGLLGAMIVAGVWGEFETTWYPRLLGVVAVLLAAVTVALPILHRASQADREAAAVPSTVRTRFCPFCGGPVIDVTGKGVTCGSCGARFRVRIEE